jgi:hypothetical protein
VELGPDDEEEEDRYALPAGTGTPEEPSISAVTSNTPKKTVDAALFPWEC